MAAGPPEQTEPFDADQPLQRAWTIPSRWYTDASVWAAERRAVFGKHWLVTGRAGQVERAGQFFTAEIAGEPLLVVRGDDGGEPRLGAFYNVCRHRAARVACEPEGTATRFRCRYHGWTYDTSGALRGVPEFDGVADFRREDNGLVPVAVDSWGPLVFVHLGELAMPLAEFLAPLPERLRPFRIESLEFVERRTYDLACNWKVFVDNYLDGGYHVNTLHRSLAGVLDYKSYRTEVFGHSSVQSSPMRQPDAGRDETSAASVRRGSEAAYWWLYPNFMLNVYEGVMDTNLVLPLGPDRCRVVFDFYFAPSGDDSAAAACFQAESIAVAERIQAEDVDICEDVQRGLGSRSFTAGRYSVQREIGVYHFHRLLARDLESGPPAT